MPGADTITVGWLSNYSIFSRNPHKSPSKSLIGFLVMMLCIVPMMGLLVNVGGSAISGSTPFIDINHAQDGTQQISTQELKAEISALDSEVTSVQALSGYIRATEPDWPMFGKDNAHSHKANQIAKGIYESTKKWDLWADSVSGSTIDSWGITIGDFTDNIDWSGAGGTERNVKYVVFAENGLITIVDGETGEYVWRLDVDLIDGQNDNDLVYTTPTLGHFNNNNKLDILFGTTDGTLYLYEPESTYSTSLGYENSTDNINSDKLWERALVLPFTQSSPVLDTIDGDSFPDIVIGAGNNIFAVSGSSGTKLWNKTLPGSMVSTPIVYLDGSDNNDNKYVLVTAYNSTNLEYTGNFFKANTGARTAVLNYTVNPAILPNLVPSPAFAELDENTNNNAELIICTPFEGLTGGRVYVYSTNRTLLWATPENSIIGQIEATPAVADIDGDKKAEVVVVTWGLTAPGAITHVYAFHGKNGTLLWHITKNTNGFPPYTNERALGSPILVDVNTDNYTDVVFSTSPNVYAINGDDGSDIWDIALVGSGRALWSTPAAADIDNDGFLDVVVEAAAISHVIIDLTMSSSDLSFSTENITENEQINIKAIIHNNGSATARNVVVSFFENDVLIGNQSETIPGKDSREVRLDWVPTEEGSRTIKIVIDPENVIEEIDEYNNELSKEVYVIPAFPDLIINSVHYYRGDGKEVDNTNTHLIAGENSTILVRVKNIGGDDGDNVIVRVFETGYPVDDDRQINKLKIQQILNVTFPWRPGLGENTISAWVDPDGNIDELNETNNEHTEKIVVNSKTPSNPKFNCDGVVHMPDGHTPAVTIDVLFTNNRTKDQLATITNATGYYAMDLSKYPEDYLEGDEIIIFASDGENESTVKFWLYSEDKNRFDNITLHMVPTYALSISVDVRSKSVLPNDNVEYLLTVTNRGNAENTVRLSISEIIDVETNNEATGWDAYLNVYMIEDIPPKSEQAGIVLTILAPNDAHARDQVLVAVTAESEDDPEQGDIVGMTTTVGRVYDFDITIEDSSYKLDPIKNNTARFNVSITNNGNDDDTVLIDLPLAEPELWSAKYNTSLDLMIGEEKEFEIILTSSESIGAGQYTFTLYVGSIDEQGNTTSTLRVEIIRADLRFSSIISFSPSKPNLNTNITFETTLHNNGTSKVARLLVVFRVNGLIQSSRSLYNFSADESEPLTFYYTPTETGEYIIEIEIDPFKNVIEGNENNNLATVELSFIKDIAVLDDIVISKNNPVEGETVTISIVIKNVGNVDVLDEFDVDFYDGDPEGDNYKWLGDTTVTDRLLVNKELVVTFDWEATGANKKHSLYVEVNSNNDFSESDYDNNIKSVDILVNEKDKTEGTSDYTNWIIVIFVIAFVMIIFMIMIPSKQPVSKSRSKHDRSKSRSGKGRGKGSGKSRSKAKGTGKGGAKLKTAKSGVKFISVDDEDTGTEVEEVEVEEVEEVEEEDEGEEVEEVEEEDEDEDEEEEAKDKRKTSTSKSNRRRKKVSFAGKLGGLFAGPSKSKRDTSKRDSKKSREDIIKTKLAAARKGRSVSEVAEIADDDDEVAEVQVVSEEVDDGLEEETKVRKKEKEKKKDKPKEKQETGWEYSQMIGIR